MSASQSYVDDDSKPFSALDLGAAPTAIPVDADININANANAAVRLFLKADADTTDLNAFGLDPSAAIGHGVGRVFVPPAAAATTVSPVTAAAAGQGPSDVDAAMIGVSAAHFADFHFPQYQVLATDDATVDLFGPPSPPSLPSPPSPASPLHHQQLFHAAATSATSPIAMPSSKNGGGLPGSGSGSGSSTTPHPKHAANVARRLSSAKGHTFASAFASAQPGFSKPVKESAPISLQSSSFGRPRTASATTSSSRPLPPPRRASFEAVVSDGESHGSSSYNNHNHSSSSHSRGQAGSLLDEPLSDEFGLALNGPIDALNMDAAAAAAGGLGASGSGAGGTGGGIGIGIGVSVGIGAGGGGGLPGSRPSLSNKDDRAAGDAAPPWSELKTKAGKERKRLPLACIACRRKKIRCSGEKPACKHCMRSRLPCVYKVTARKAAPRTDYMAMLDKRLKRMEDRIIKIVPRADQDPAATASVSRAIVRPAIPGSLPPPASTSTVPGGSTGNGAGASASASGSSAASAVAASGSSAVSGAGPAASSGPASSGAADPPGAVSGDTIATTMATTTTPTTTATTAVSATAANYATPSNKAATKKRPADEAFGPELDHWARDSSRNHIADITRPHNILLQQESEECKLLQEGADALPPLDIQTHLADVYFENIYGQVYHLLHKPSYMRKLSAGKLPPVLVLSVCAVAARFSSHPKLGSSTNFLRGEEWASHARDIVTRRYEWPNITILTCLLLLGLHEFGTCHGGRSWALGGQAIRMAFALQLHKDLEHDPLPVSDGAPLSFTDREIRRRTMWACFLMDRFNSSGTDRPTFIREETIKIQLPVKEKNFQHDIPGQTENLAGQPVTPPPSSAPAGIKDLEEFSNTTANMGVAAYMIRAIAVWGRVIGYLNQGAKELDPMPKWNPESEYRKLARQADEILSTLPASLVFTQENLNLHRIEGMANQFLFLHIAMQQNILFLNRFAVISPNGSSQQDVPKAFVTKAGAKAFAAANRISELLKDAESYLIAAPFVGYCAYFSSTVHIFGIFSRNPSMEATCKRNLVTNVRFLSKMKRYWGMFHFMAEHLREQYRTCADAARQGAPAGENAAVSSPIFQYGDWFDRYPHGVSNSDFTDPLTYAKKEKGDDGALEQKAELHTVEELLTQTSDGSGNRMNSGVGNVNATSKANIANATAKSTGDNSKSGSSANNGSSNANHTNHTNHANNTGNAAGSSGMREPGAAGRSTSFLSKRKSTGRKASTGSSLRGGGGGASNNGDHQSLEPILTELGAVNMEALQHQHPAHLQHQQQQSQAFNIQRRHQYSTSLDDLTGAPGNFNPLALPHSQVTAAAAVSYHAATMSPISPVPVSPFSLHPPHQPQHQHQQHQQHQQQQSHQHHQQQQPQQQQQHAFFPPDFLALSLAQQPNGMLPQLDRQLVFNAYGSGLDQAAAVAAINGQNALNGMGWDGPGLDAEAVQRGAGSPGSVAAVAAAAVAAGNDPSAVTAADAMQAFGPQETSSAWFMPFNIEPPEISHDFGGVGGLDQFASLFGSGAMPTQGNGNGGMGGGPHPNSQ